MGLNGMQFPIIPGATAAAKCSRGAVMLRREETDGSVWGEYLLLLQKMGYDPLWNRTCGPDRFSAFTNGALKLSLSYLHAERSMRVIAEAMPQRVDFSKQMQICHSAVAMAQFSTHTSRSTKIRGSASGMGYIWRLTDNRLIGIDGGFHLAPEFQDDYPSFLNLLRELSGEKKPRIALWILTHPHIDHYGLLKKIQPEDAEITAFMATLPPEGIDDGACRDIMAAIPDFQKKNIPAHTGDYYSFGDAELEIYCTCEELAAYDEEPIRRDTNNQSLIFGIRAGGQQVVFTGDARFPTLNRAVSLCGKRLHAEICQIPHHGRTVAGDDAFLSYVAPQVALWPASRVQVDYDTEHLRVNTWIFSDASTVKEHIVANDGTAVLTLPHSPRSIPYRMQKE